MIHANPTNEDNKKQRKKTDKKENNIANFTSLVCHKFDALYLEHVVMAHIWDVL